jgi:hypothetical protein
MTARLIPPIVAAIACVTATADAETATLDQAKRAIDTVDYERARGLLADALHEGGNSPAALAEIYRLSARTAIVFEQPDVAEQFYRRWLEIDAAATLPADTSPKLRAAFEAARAFVAANGRLVAHASATSRGTVEIIVSDPVAMARAVGGIAPSPAGDGPRVALGLDHRAELPRGVARVAILDDDGNRLAEIAVEPFADRSDRRWVTWTIIAGSLGVVAVGSATIAVVAQRDANDIAAHSAGHTQAEADDAVRRARIFAISGTISGTISGALAVAAAVPAILLHRRAPTRARAIAIVPTVGGVVIAGGF